MDISLQEPSRYVNRMTAGCILDPSVFYSAEHVDAVSSLVSEMPGKVLLPRFLHESIVGRRGPDRGRFRETLTLWGARYEEIGGAWRKSGQLLERLRVQPINVESDPHELRVALKSDPEKNSVNETIYEIAAGSIERSFPVLACELASFRLIELLRRFFDTVVVEPGGKWAQRKREALSSWSAAASFALHAANAAFLFVEVARDPDVLPGIVLGTTLVIIVIDG